MKIKEKDNTKKINEDIKLKRLLNKKTKEEKLGYFLNENIYLGVK